MRVFIDGTPGLEEPPEELAEKAWRAFANRPAGADIAAERGLPLFTTAGLSVRIRFVFELPPADAGSAGGLLPALPTTPAVSTLAWFWVHVLEGLLWESGGQVAELHVRREWGRVAGVEVTV